MNLPWLLECSKYHTHPFVGLIRSHTGCWMMKSIVQFGHSAGTSPITEAGKRKGAAVECGGVVALFKDSIKNASN